ncbi:MAG: SMI1/KNR4 family protein [Acidobacteria bacterium]|nr:SMI1/KNR4 family protein [Acidobacteriota bacterium]
MLQGKNGFYAFESALHVFSSGCRNTTQDIEKWNEYDLWKKGYGELLRNYLFFAEDAFGAQFGIYSSRVIRFDPESGESEEIAKDIEEWAEIILADYDYQTGYSLAHQWQAKNGTLREGKRLLPKIPFILGGAYEVENLYAGDTLEGIYLRAGIWRQIHELPDGAQIELKVIE